MKLMIEFTAPNGSPVWVDSTEIEKFMPSIEHEQGTLLWIAGNTQEVKEQPADVLDMLTVTMMKFRRLHRDMRGVSNFPKKDR